MISDARINKSSYRRTKDSSSKCWIKHVTWSRASVRSHPFVEVWGEGWLSGTDRCFLECLRTQWSFCRLKKLLVLSLPFIFHLGSGHWLSERGAIDIKPGHCLLFLPVSLKRGFIGAPVIRLPSYNAGFTSKGRILHHTVYVREKISFTKCEGGFVVGHQWVFFKNENSESCWFKSSTISHNESSS